MNYKDSGVNVQLEENSMKVFLNNINQTHKFNKYTVGENGYFANTIKLNDDISIIVSTDGIGTKTIISEICNKYDTVGIDLIAMIVNDIICLNAKPFTIQNCLSVKLPDENLLEQISIGLLDGAKLANISISGGEIAQINDILKSKFDLTGTGIGIVNNDKIIDGKNISRGDIILGIESNGLHSNGYSLVRKVLFEERRYRVDNYIEEFQSNLGEELLKPTHIYSSIMDLNLDPNKVKALINITGDGLLNILRVRNNNVQFIIDNLPEPNPIFKFIQENGNISNKEMFQTFNMGIGFCLIIDERYVNEIKNKIENLGFKTYKIGFVESSNNAKRLILTREHLIGFGRHFINN